MTLMARLTTVACLLMLHEEGTEGFALVAPVTAIMGSRLSPARPRRSGRALMPPWSMQMPQWIDAAATQQGRDPLRLAPLKPLIEEIVIRMPKVNSLSNVACPALRIACLRRTLCTLRAHVHCTSNQMRAWPKVKY